MAGRILQRGDVVALVERAEEAVDQAEAGRLARKATSKRGMDLADFLSAMQQVQNMGPLSSLMGMLPGVGPKLPKGVNLDDRRIKHLEAIVRSMTPEERRRPDVLNGSRRARVAKGAGRPVQEVNQLIKQFDQMRQMMQKFGRKG